MDQELPPRHRLRMSYNAFTTAAHPRLCLDMDTDGEHLHTGAHALGRAIAARTGVLAVQILRFADDGLWGRRSALGIIMIFISTALVLLATLVGSKFKLRTGPHRKAKLILAVAGAARAA